MVEEEHGKGDEQVIPEAVLMQRYNTYKASGMAFIVVMRTQVWEETEKMNGHFRVGSLST